MYNLCKTIRIGKYAFTFDFYIHKEALIIEWLFESLNPTRRISIEFNTSSFLLSYLDRLIGIEVDDIYNWKKNLICGYVLSMNDTPVHIRCESIDKYQNSYEYPTILQRWVAVKKSYSLKKIWSNNVTVANQYAESAIPHKTVHTQCYTGLCFTLKNLANALQKHFEYDQIKTKIFGLKDEGYEAIETRKGMNHKLPSFRCSLKIQRYLSCEIFTQRFPLFSTDFRFSTGMLIFRK